MKKRSLHQLALNKKLISNLSQSKIYGGGTTTLANCELQSYGTCKKEEQTSQGCDQP